MADTNINSGSFHFTYLLVPLLYPIIRQQLHLYPDLVLRALEWIKYSLRTNLDAASAWLSTSIPQVQSFRYEPNWGKNGLSPNIDTRSRLLELPGEVILEILKHCDHPALVRFMCTSGDCQALVPASLLQEKQRGWKDWSHTNTAGFYCPGCGTFRERHQFDSIQVRKKVGARRRCLNCCWRQGQYLTGLHVIPRSQGIQEYSIRVCFSCAKVGGLDSSWTFATRGVPQYCSDCRSEPPDRYLIWGAWMRLLQVVLLCLISGLAWTYARPESRQILQCITVFQMFGVLISCSAVLGPFAGGGYGGQGYRDLYASQLAYDLPQIIGWIAIATSLTTGVGSLRVGDRSKVPASDVRDLLLIPFSWAVAVSYITTAVIACIPLWDLPTPRLKTDEQRIAAISDFIATVPFPGPVYW